MTTRIKGPTDKPPVDQAGAVDEAGSVRDVGGAPEVAAPARPSSTGAPDAVSQVAAKLRAGEISVEQAVELLIDDAIERQVGRALDSARDLEPQLRELLRNYAANDPHLAAKIRRLTSVK